MNIELKSKTWLIFINPSINAGVKHADGYQGFSPQFKIKR